MPSTSEIIQAFMRAWGEGFHDVASFQHEFFYDCYLRVNDPSIDVEAIPPGPTLHRLYSIESGRHLATIDLIFSDKGKLLNYSVGVVPEEFLKHKAIKNCVNHVVFPFLFRHVCNPWQVIRPPHLPPLPTIDEPYQQYTGSAGTMLFPNEDKNLVVHVVTVGKPLVDIRVVFSDLDFYASVFGPHNFFDD